jgi:hypothetical protein
MNHNLDIHHYSFVDILGLFDLTYIISIEDLKRAKKKVLMSHPDKSKLAPDYFLFYKKAFDIVYDYYCNNNKVNVEVNAENTKYVKLDENILNNSSTKKVTQIINDMDKSVFNDKFNELFEKNMVSNRPAASAKNEWFTKDSELYENMDKSVTPGNIGKVFETMKNQNNSIIRHRDFNDMTNNMVGSNLYDDDNDCDDGQYVTSNPFSKLKYDDLRKVHKDETIFAVKESDYNNVYKYKSVDEINRARTADKLTPIDKPRAERMLYEQEEVLKKQIAEKKYQSTLRTNEYAEKNKNVLANFLRIQNV